MKHVLCYLILSVFITTFLNAADYYWIGGAGNWSDISHWATTSGGILTHDQVPTADDDVYFDANSFTGSNQVVTINNDNIFFRNLDWTGATGSPIFQGDVAKVINVFGSLHFIVDMTVDFSGEVRFLSPDADTLIDFVGHHLGREVLFDGAGGWILQDSLVVDSLIWYKNGVLNTNNQNMHTDYFKIDNHNNGKLILGNSRITINGRNIYRAVGFDFFSYLVMEVNVGGNFTIDPGNSIIELTSDDATALMHIAADPIQFNDLYFSNPSGTSGLDVPWQAAHFGQVRFSSHAYIVNIGAEHLFLSPAKEYSFFSGYTYPLDSITAVGNCLGTITLQGTESNNNSTIFVSNDNQIELDFVNLKNITATGTSTYVANNSADLGNNSGWTINSRSVQDLYWVGGSGNWDDPAHWSLNSGGLGGVCIPSGTDNVFFDENSFSAPGQQVHLNIENPRCRDMSWTGSAHVPTLIGDYDVTLHIFGSLTLIEDMSYEYGGYLLFEAQEPGKTITTGNNQVNKVWFRGNGGEWTLQDSLKMETNLLLVSGTLNTNSQYVESTEMNASYGEGSRKLILGNTHWVIKHFVAANRDLWTILLNDFELDAGTSTIEFVGVEKDGYIEHFGNGDIAYHTIIFTNNEGYLKNFDTGINCSIDVLTFKKGGHVFNDFTIRSLQLEPGFTYFLKQGTTQTITELVASGNCNALVSIRSMATGSPAMINAQDDQVLQYLSLRDIHSTGTGMLTAQNSIDLGNNQGWIIEELSSRTLYWVGGTGNWADPAHWSLASGGSGGQCIPTLRDDAIFDAGSFTVAGQEVQGGERNGYYCRNMTWEDNLPDPIFDLNRLFCHGSAVFSVNMNNQLGNFHMSGSGMETVLFNGQSFNDVYQDGDGDYTFLDGLTASQIFLQSGTLNTNGQPLTLARFQIDNEFSPVALNLGNSYIQLTEPFDVIYPLEAAHGNNTTINPGTSIIELTHPNAGALLSGGLNFNNVIFSGTDGLLTIRHRENGSSINDPAFINLLELGGDAIVEGFHNIDSLIFAPGKSYQLAAYLTQTVNEYLQILGNNCSPIELFSTQPGAKATIAMDDGVVNSDFVQMRDQVATGGVSFFAGVHSTDIDNANEGWIFETQPDFVEVGFFGQDRSICQGDVLSLSAYNYSSGETYVWSTGSTNATIPISQAGAYWARVTFGNMCEISDTISISTIEPAAINLGVDTQVCQGDSLVLDATSTISGVSYTWQDGSTQSDFLANTSGTYSVAVTSNGCTGSDEVMVTFNPLPQFSLGMDRSFCEGEMLNFNFSGVGDSYEWHDGVTSSTYIIDQGGQYSLAIGLNGCTFADTLVVSVALSPDVELGPDISVCEEELVILDAAVSQSDDFFWQDGSKETTFRANQSGVYWLEAVLGACSTRDSILVNIQSPPELGLADSLILCEGETLLLQPTFTDGKALWQDGSTTSKYLVEKEGTYSVTVDNGICVAMDEVNVVLSSCGKIRVYVPNAFSPNQDGQNDLFFPNIDPNYQILDYQLHIFDRWGNLVFHTKDPDAGWDGIIAGRDANFGVYVYMLEFTFDDQGEASVLSLAGDVSLVR